MQLALLCPFPGCTGGYAIQSLLIEFLCLGQAQSQFAMEILRILTEERRLTASHRANSTRKLELFKTGDLVFAMVEVQSSSATNRVGKLSIRKRGPFEIVAALPSRPPISTWHRRVPAVTLNIPTTAGNVLPSASGGAHREHRLTPAVQC